MASSDRRCSTATARRSASSPSAPSASTAPITRTSSENAQDKRNVRDGHYHIWSYTHWLLPTDGAGNALKPLAARIIGLIVGNPVAPPPAFEPLDAEIQVGLVPRCAMKVARTSEGGDLTLDAPVAPCGCYFESRTGGTSCTACTDNSACGSGRCRHGYCEAR